MEGDELERQRRDFEFLRDNGIDAFFGPGGISMEEEMELMNRFLQLQDLKKVLAKNLGERIILKY